MTALKYKEGSVWKDYIDVVYPVGSIYMSHDTTSPADLFGGTWSKVNGTNYLRLNSDDTTAGGTGGSSSVSHSHRLPIGWDKIGNDEPRIWGWNDPNGYPQFGSNTYTGLAWQLLGNSGANLQIVGGIVRMAFSDNTEVPITPTYWTVNLWYRTA
jgi:hypothetical protein